MTTPESQRIVNTTPMTADKRWPPAQLRLCPVTHVPADAGSEGERKRSSVIRPLDWSSLKLPVRLQPDPLVGLAHSGHLTRPFQA